MSKRPARRGAHAPKPAFSAQSHLSDLPEPHGFEGFDAKASFGVRKLAFGLGGLSRFCLGFGNG